MSHPAMPSAATGFADLGLPPRLVAALARHGFERPFPIQTATIPDVLAGRDVLGRGQTGSGKTLAFGLPLLARLTGRTAAPHRPLAMVLVPTRELALQVCDALTPLAHPLGLRVRPVVGGMPMGKQIDALRRGLDVVVATPGRLTDLVERRACDLGSVEISVLDEADHMTDLGFLPAVSALLDRTPPGGQRLLFSATLDGEVDTVVRRYLSDPVSHGTDSATSAPAIDHHLLVVRPPQMAQVVAGIANRRGRTLLFVRTKHGADRLATQLGRVGVGAVALHGGKTQPARNRSLAAFRDGRVSALVATDVAARGIHVDGIDLVVHVDPPTDHKDYTHRAGRTARAGESGTVVTLVPPQHTRAVERLMRRAGVTVTPTAVSPGDDTLVEVTGSRVPSGVALAAADADAGHVAVKHREPGRRRTYPPRHGGGSRPRGAAPSRRPR